MRSREASSGGGAPTKAPIRRFRAATISRSAITGVPDDVADADALFRLDGGGVMICLIFLSIAR